MVTIVVKAAAAAASDYDQVLFNQAEIISVHCCVLKIANISR